MEFNRPFCAMQSMCPQQNSCSCSGTGLRRKIWFVPAVERLQGWLSMGYLLCLFFLYFYEADVTEKTFRKMPSEIYPKASGQHLLEERMASALSFRSFHLLPSIPYPNLGTRRCSAVDSAVIATADQTHLTTSATAALLCLLAASSTCLTLCRAVWAL